MADEKEEIQKLAQAIRAASDASSARFEKEKAQAEEIKRLYEERIDIEGNLKEVVSQNNRIMELEAQRAKAKFEEAIEISVEYERTLQNGQEIVEKINKARKAGDKEELKRLNKLLEQHTAVEKRLREEKIKVDQNIDAYKSLADEKVALDNANKKTQSSLRNVLKTMTGLTGETQTAIGAFAQLTGPQQTALLGNLKNVIKATFDPFLVAEAILMKIFESTLAFMKQFDTLAANFRKNTGIIERGFDGMEQRIVNVQRANLRMGVTMEEAFGAQSALVSGMAQFTSMTDDAQDQVLRATVIMQEFGVSASTTADIFNTFSKGLGFNSQQLEKLSTQIMGVATSLKVPPQIIATDFNMASKELMKYGDDMFKVFEGLAEQAKQTGLALSELLGIAKQFDTFEAAGTAVGKLNAILGGPYLNAINMVYAQEEERIKALRESIKLSGRQFNELHRHEQQAIATAAGISDMAVAAKLFGGTESEFANTRMSMQEMQERAQKAQSVQEKFTQVMQSFAIALGPLVHVLGLVAEALIIVMNPLGHFLETLGVDDPKVLNAIGAITVGIYGLAAAIKMGLLKSLLAVVVAVAPFAGFFALFTAFFSIFDKKIRGMVAGFFALAGAITLVALAFGATVGPLGVAAAVAALTAGAAVSMGMLDKYQGMASFSTGKDKGVPVRGGAGLVAEKGREMVLADDGNAYMVNSPSVVELGTQDTVYTNAQTEMILNGGGNNGAELAQMRASQEQFLQSMREDRKMLERSISELASRPLVAEIDGKKVWKNQRGYMMKDPNLRLV